MSEETIAAEAAARKVTSKRRSEGSGAVVPAQPRDGMTILACNHTNLGFLLRNPWFWLVTVPAIVLAVAITMGCHRPVAKATVTGHSVITRDTGQVLVLDTSEGRYEFNVPGKVHIDFSSEAEYKVFQDAVATERAKATAEFLRQYQQLVTAQLQEADEKAKQAEGAAQISAARFIQSVHREYKQPPPVTAAVNNR